MSSIFGANGALIFITEELITSLLRRFPRLVIQAELQPSDPESSEGGGGVGGHYYIITVNNRPFDIQAINPQTRRSVSNSLRFSSPSVSVFPSSRLETLKMFTYVFELYATVAIERKAEPDNAYVAEDFSDLEPVALPIDEEVEVRILPFNPFMISLYF